MPYYCPLGEKKKGKEDVKTELGKCAQYLISILPPHHPLYASDYLSLHCLCYRRTVALLLQTLSHWMLISTMKTFSAPALSAISTIACKSLVHWFLPTERGAAVHPCSPAARTKLISIRIMASWANHTSLLKWVIILRDSEKLNKVTLPLEEGCDVKTKHAQRSEILI